MGSMGQKIKNAKNTPKAIVQARAKIDQLARKQRLMYPRHRGWVGPYYPENSLVPNTFSKIGLHKKARQSTTF